MIRVLQWLEPVVVVLIAIGTIVAIALTTSRAKADIAQDWNNIALDLQARGNLPTNAPLFGNAVNSNPGTRASAIQWLAVNDATVPLTGANNPYYSQLAAPSLPGGFQDLAVQAAVAQASHDAIVGTLPSLGFNAAQQLAWTTDLDAKPRALTASRHRRTRRNWQRLRQVNRWVRRPLRKSWRCEQPMVGTHRLVTRFRRILSLAIGSCRRTRR
jgi:hypothetical protein